MPNETISQAKRDANIANAQLSHGPVTDAGRATSSKNATKFGLFTLHDFIQPGEEAAYAELAAGIEAELQPEGVIEQGLAAEVRNAMWRLRRCRIVEAQLADTFAEADGSHDPMLSPGTDAEKIQKSIDRARAQASRLRKQAMAELRQLQTERRIRSEIFPDADTSELGVVDSGKVLQATIAAKRNAALQEKMEQEDAFKRFDQEFGPPKAA